MARARGKYGEVGGVVVVLHIDCAFAGALLQSPHIFKKVVNRAEVPLASWMARGSKLFV